jgi:hypothetical protein
MALHGVESCLMLLGDWLVAVALGDGESASHPSYTGFPYILPAAAQKRVDEE